MRILITGYQGFLGHFLWKKLEASFKEKNLTLVGFDGDLLKAQDRARYFYKDCSWDFVIHLAGIGSVPGCDADHATAFQINAVGTFLVCEEIRKFCPRAQMIFSSTGQVYDLENDLERPVDESHAVKPVNIYAKTKRAAELYLQDSFKNFGGSYVILRIFNHSHKTQRPEFFMPSIYQQIMLKKNSDNEVKLEVGNIEVERDIGAIQDLIEAFAALVMHRKDGQEIYNLCSGQGKKLSKVIDELSKALNINVKIKVQESRIRKDDPLKMIASVEKLKQAYGWAPLNADNEKKLVASFLSDI